ncbi:hypothetical protein AALO_G00077360 [Alosa alosa]|uniref:Uncharacterized protein n=1 Tax=Alosa alosa TaxID=278164 RepID=A0AAV6GW99_9TELE|nr:hypothetical protein AALO_G00077360 [Alosa alosa]
MDAVHLHANMTLTPGIKQNIPPFHLPMHLPFHFLLLSLPNPNTVRDGHREDKACRGERREEKRSGDGRREERRRGGGGLGHQWLWSLSHSVLPLPAAHPAAH